MEKDGYESLKLKDGKNILEDVIDELVRTKMIIILI